MNDNWHSKCFWVAKEYAMKDDRLVYNAVQKIDDESYFISVYCRSDGRHYAKTFLSETDIIINEFEDKNRRIPFVNERFHPDYRPDHEWRWQQNRAIVGHNLKIAWNLTRVANYNRYLLAQNLSPNEKAEREERVERSMTMAKRLGQAMIDAGLDKLRGGCYDALEREPRDGCPVEFVWGNHKDFWQQEQNILAYLILYGYTKDFTYLDLARDACAWWNAFQLDRNNRGVFFRVSDNGQPFIAGRGMGGYDIAGYHSFELNFLAHIYIRTYVSKPDSETDFCLYFRPSKSSSIQTLNVLPDFMQPNTLDVTSIKVDGKARQFTSHRNFQIPIEPNDLGREICVDFRTKAI